MCIRDRIEASMMTGAILAGANEQEVSAVEKAAGNIGLAFQIQDDILDVTLSLIHILARQRVRFPALEMQ